MGETIPRGPDFNVGCQVEAQPKYVSLATKVHAGLKPFQPIVPLTPS
jgi:hypothetical protein